MTNLLNKRSLIVTSLLISAIPTISNAALWDVATIPLFLAKTADPLITLIWDDSGSMLVEKTPESTDYSNFAYPVSFSNSQYYSVASYGSGTNSKLVRDTKQNPLFFDPFKTYQPWINANGTLMDDAIYTSLWKSPLKTHPDDQYMYGRSSCKALNITKNSYKPCYSYAICNGFSSCQYSQQTSFAPGDYFYNGKAYNLKTNYAANWFYSGSPARTAANNRANAANWYTYYRDRKNTAKAAIGYALQDIPENIKIGFTTFSRAKDYPNSPLLFNYMTFTGNSKQTLFDTVYNEDNAGGTPLREALLNVNNYIKNTNSLWYEGNVPLTCRRVYNIVISDGAWNDGSLSYTNADGTNGPTITGTNGRSYTYSKTAADSYPDTYNSTLADIAMDFWKNDLRPDLVNNQTVPDGFKNQAFWQHIVTHAINLNDSLPTDIPNTWPNVTSSSNTDQRYLDLWHSALNSKGDYIFSTNFDELTAALKTFLADAANVTSTVGLVNTGLVTSDYKPNSNSMLYKTFFNPITWSGDLKAYSIDAAGNLGTTNGGLLWSATEKLPIPDNRQVIVMLKTVTGTLTPRAFRKNILTSVLSLIPALPVLTDDTINYFRGDRSKEGFQYDTGTKGLRVRSSPIGDFVSSKPIYVGAPNSEYTDSTYTTFKQTNASRTPMIYAADNQGFLHGFNANTGVEMFAVLTHYNFGQLTARTAMGAPHVYGIDGTPRAGDAYFNNQWNTILVTPLGAGGKGLFSMNVTNPASITEATAPTLTGNGFWLFDDSKDNDLGYTFSDVSIARVKSSTSTPRWSVIFGNGYNNIDNDGYKSTTGNAVLYVLNAQDGSIIRKLDTGVGTSADPNAAGRPNGLSSPSVIDYDNDGIADFVYAGDIFGNMWKFDIRNVDPTKWTTVKLFNNTNKSPLQSVTTAPDVKKVNSGQGVMVYFGTGKFMGSDDNTGNQKNAIYGILDNFTTTAITTAQLVNQTVSDLASTDGNTYRTLSNNQIDWNNKLGWMITLPTNELILNKPRLSQGYLLLASYVPDPANTVCANNQKGFVYLVDPVTGGHLQSSTIDINSDGVIDENDLVNNSVVSGIQINTEYSSSPVIMQMDDKTNKLLVNTQNGSLLSLVTARSYSAPAQRSWKKVRSPDAEKK